MNTLERVRADLATLIDASNDVENVAEYGSPAHREATRRGNAYRTALDALKDAD